MIDWRRLSVLKFVVALMLFLAPFATYSCAGQPVQRVTGAEFVFGKTVSAPSMFSQEPSETRIEPEPLVIAAAIATAVALVMTLMTPVRTLVALVSGIGAVSLISFKFDMDRRVAEQGEGLVQVEYGAAYWGVVLILVASVVLAFVVKPAEHDSG